MADRRRAFTLIEVVVALAILAILAGLLISAVPRVRMAAVRMQSLNNLKQISLGLQNYAAVHERLPGVVNPRVWDYDRDPPVFLRLLGFVEGEPAFTQEELNMPVHEQWLVLGRVRKTYVSPADPSLTQEAGKDGYAPCSYSANITALTGLPTLHAGFPDGTSNTIAFTERYSIIYDFPSYGVYNIWEPGPQPPPGRDPGDWIYHGHRRASFADSGWGDVVPVTTGFPPVTRPSIPGLTFQVQPTLEQSISRIPQTPFAAGLPVANFDGSVRTVSPSVNPEVFWSAVTPAGGESAGW